MTTDAAPRPSVSPLVLATIIGIGVYVVIDVLLAFLRPDYSLLSNFESDYTRGRFCWLMDVNFVIRGVFSACAAIALRRSGLAPRWAAILLWVWAVGSALLAAFPDNPVGYPRVWTGGIHLLIALIAFLAALVGMLGISFHRLEHDRLLLRWISAVAFVAFVLLGRATLIGGLLERTFLGLVLAWLVVAVLHRPAK